MVSSVQVFCELIQLTLGNRESLSIKPTEAQWRVLLKMAQDQTIEGVLSEAFAKLPEEQRPGDDSIVYYEWLGRAMVVEQKDRLVEGRCAEALSFFRSNGFACSILKGQAMARLYPVPQHRSAGDIDVWLKGSRKEIYDFSLRTTNDIVGVNYHHIHYPLFEDTEVEAHIWPSYFSNPVFNKRFQKWCDQYMPTMDISIPTMAFNRVYILLHCYRHLLGHGVGMRQLMDYYFVLKQGFGEEERLQTIADIRSMGMMTFCKATMWFMKNVFGLDDRYLLMEPDEKEGRFLLKEVMLTGNMGHSDRRIDHQKAYATPLRRFFSNIRREVHLVTHYPREIVWNPIFSIYLYFWRLFKGFLK